MLNIAALFIVLTVAFISFMLFLAVAVLINELSNDYDRIKNIGFTDGYYGKDNSEYYSMLNKMFYKLGQRKFIKEFNETGV